ncbi:hypothetical protein GCM10027612_81020 [Microbispora bryophytorum subsp. camponoti]
MYIRRTREPAGATGTICRVRVSWSRNMLRAYVLPRHPHPGPYTGISAETSAVISAVISAGLRAGNG